MEKKNWKPREKLLDQGKNRTTDSALLWCHDFNPEQEDSVFTTVPSLLPNWHCLATSCAWHLNLAVTLSYLKLVFLTVFNWTEHFREAVLLEFVTTSVGLSGFYFKLISWALYKVEFLGNDYDKIASKFTLMYTIEKFTAWRANTTLNFMQKTGIARIGKRWVQYQFSRQWIFLESHS